jgi:hypothetical protein
MPDAAVAPQAGARAVAQRNALLTEANRASNVTPSSTPYWRLVEAVFHLDLAEREFYGEATLAGSPPEDINQAPTVFWSVGTIVGNTCQPLGSDYFHDWFPGLMANEADDLPTGWEAANCAVAELRRAGDGVVVDVLIGVITDELPTLRLGAPELLGSPRVKLVPGVWTKLDVDVMNDGPGVASGVVVTGHGKGLKVRKGEVSFGISRNGTGSAEIQVKLVGKKGKARLALTAATGEAKASRSVTVRRTAAPKSPVPGAYASKDGAVSFSITKGRPKLTGFRVRTQTTCGGYGTIPTYTMNTYDFPKTTIPRNGIVDSRDGKDDLYGVSLQLKVVGGKVTKGRFSYSGPGTCRAIEEFTAKRSGR